MYTVGQIIYVLLSREKSIVPMQIIEEISRKSKDGMTVSYMAALGSGDSKENIMLSEIKGEIFASLKEVRESLISKATTTIDALVSSAEKKAVTWYPTAFSGEKPEVPQPEEAPQVNHEYDMVQLPDGRMARLKTSLHS